MKKREFLALGGALPLMMAGCGGNSSGSAQVRLLNATEGYTKVDLTVDNVSVTGGTGVAQDAISAYASVAAGTHTSTLSDVTSGSSLYLQSRTLTKDGKYTVVAYGFSGSARTLQVFENQTAPETGFGALSILNTSVDIGIVDIYVTPTSDLTGQSPLLRSVSGPSQTAYTSVGQGTYTITVTGTNKAGADIRMVASGVTIADQQILTLVLVPGPSGVLAKGLLLDNTAGTVTPYANPNMRVRIVGGVGDGRGVAMLANGGAIASSDATLTTSPSIGRYVVLPATTTLGVNVINADASVTPVPISDMELIDGTITTTISLVAGTDYTLMVFGDPNNGVALKARLVLDDNRRPSLAVNIKVRLVHLINNDSADLTLQVNSIPVASNIHYGVASPYAETAALAGQNSTILLTQALQPLYTLSQGTQASNLYTMFAFQTPPTVANPNPAPTPFFYGERQ